LRATVTQRPFLGPKGDQPEGEGGKLIHGMTRKAASAPWKYTKEGGGSFSPRGKNVCARGVEHKKGDSREQKKLVIPRDLI